MKIAPGNYSMGQRNGGRVHAFLLGDGPGLTRHHTLYDGDTNVILGELASIGKRPTDIKRIILTHGHKSHVGGLAAIARSSGAPVYAHEMEIPIIEGRQKATPVGWRKPANLEVGVLQF